MALTRAQLLSPTSSAPRLPNQPSGVKDGTQITVDGTGVATLNPTGVQPGTYFSANIQVDSYGRILAAQDGAGGGGGGFSRGTQVLFANASAPLGWAQVVTSNVDNVAIRLTVGTGGGTGGSVPFNVAFSGYTPTGNCNIASLQVKQSVVTGTISPTTISINQMAGHKHVFGATKVFQYQPGGGAGAFNGFSGGFTNSDDTLATGGGLSHTHTFSGFANGGDIEGSVIFTGTPTQQFAVRYYDMIVAVRV